MRILIVHEDIIFQNIVKWAVEQRGCTTQVVPSIRLALKRLEGGGSKNEPVPDLVLSDYWLRDGTGRDLIEGALLLGFSGTFCIFTSRLEEAWIHGRDFSQIQWFNRPILWEELIQKIDALLKKERKRRNL